MIPPPRLFDVNGDVPKIEGRVCEAFLCQSYWEAGREIDPANGVYLKFDGAWHRLYFDIGMIFWRPHDGPPEAFEEPAEGWSYRITDIGSLTGIVGATLTTLDMSWAHGEVRTSFEFSGRQRVVIAYNPDNETSTWRTGPIGSETTVGSGKAEL